MRKSHAAALAASIIGIITLLGQGLIVLFVSLLGVLTSTIGIVLLVILGISSLLLSGPYHRTLRRFITDKAQVRTLALLSLLAAIVWLLVLLLPDINVALSDAAALERPVWQAALLMVAAFIILLKMVDVAVAKASQFAEMIGVSPFVISFFLVGVLSALPESTIALVTNLQGDANGAAGALLSSNVADLALIFGVIALLLKGASIKSEALKRDVLYLPILLLPLVLMFDGTLSRIDGVILLASGLLFFGVIAAQVNWRGLHWPAGWMPFKTLLLLIGSLALMLAAANVTVTTAGDVGTGLGVPSIIISVLVVGVGVCLPELLFAIQSVWRKTEGMALGNVLAVVMIDATIMLGITALARPMVVDASLFLLTNIFMGLAALCIIYFARTVRKLAWQEGVVMLSIYGVYLFLIMR